MSKLNKSRVKQTKLIFAQHTASTYLQRLFLGQLESCHFQIERLCDAKGRFLQRRNAIAIQTPVERVDLSRVLIGKGFCFPHSFDAIRDGS